MVINPDSFRFRLGIYTRAQTPNVGAGITYNDVLINTVWGGINPKKGSTYLYGQNINEVDTTIFQIRYIDYLTSEHWIAHTIQNFKTNDSKANDSLIILKIYRILTVKNILQLDRFQELECEEYKQT